MDEQFVSVENQQRVLISSDPAELLEMILIAEMPDPDSWFERLNTDPTPS